MWRIFSQIYYIIKIGYKTKLNIIIPVIVICYEIDLKYIIIYLNLIKFASNYYLRYV